MRNAKLLLTLLAALSCPIMANADSAGTTVFNFLSFDTSARAVGMGGAYTALASNSTALAYNPAGLTRGSANEAAFMHNQHFQGITQEYFSYASSGGWGASLNYLSFGDIPKTTISNPSGTGLGEVALRDMAVGVGYATALSKNVLFGAGVKLVRESIAGEKAQGFMFDGGILFNVPAVENLTLGLALKNIGPNIKFQETNEALPHAVHAGAAYNFNCYRQKTTVSLDAQKTKDEDVVFKLGAEVLAGGIVPLRAGFTTANDDGPGISVGTGYSSQNINLDYAYVPFKDLGNTHRFSISFRWGKRS